MKPKRRFTKRGTAKSSKRMERQDSRRTGHLITRAEARRRAERHVLKRMFKGATVREVAEAKLKLYNVRREDAWVVYKNPREDGLRPSDVAVVCKRTGRVLYEGSACDEG